MKTIKFRFAVLEAITGPPFTIQRLCEVLLWPHEMYTSIDKLALALEKVKLAKRIISNSQVKLVSGHVSAKQQLVL